MAIGMLQQAAEPKREPTIEQGREHLAHSRGSMQGSMTSAEDSAHEKQIANDRVRHAWVPGPNKTYAKKRGRPALS